MSSLFENFRTLSPDDSWEIDNNTTYGWVAQTFTVGNVEANTNYTIDYVKLRLGSFQSTTDKLYVYIMIADINGKPIRDLTLWSGYISISSITTDLTNGAWYQINKSGGTGFIVNPNTKYAVVVNYPYQSSGLKAVGWFFNSNLYSGGSIHYSTNDGETWTASSYDFLFEIWGTPTTIQETIGWEANVPDHGVVTHNFYLFSLYGTNTDNTIGGFQISQGTYKTVSTASMSRIDDLITSNISQYDCLTIIAENYNTSTGEISGIYDAWIQNNVV